MGSLSSVSPTGPAAPEEDTCPCASRPWALVSRVCLRVPARLAVLYACSRPHARGPVLGAREAVPAGDHRPGGSSCCAPSRKPASAPSDLALTGALRDRGDNHHHAVCTGCAASGRVRASCTLLAGPSRAGMTSCGLRRPGPCADCAAVTPTRPRAPKPREASGYRTFPTHQLTPTNENVITKPLRTPRVRHPFRHPAAATATADRRITAPSSADSHLVERLQHLNV